LSMVMIELYTLHDCFTLYLCIIDALNI
jgi:hypothetical protein